MCGASSVSVERRASNGDGDVGNKRNLIYSLSREMEMSVALEPSAGRDVVWS